jgi:pentatricopeptide repeat protein
MINELCKMGLFDEVEALLSKMEDNGIIPNAVTYETIIWVLFYKDENENWRLSFIRRTMV